MTAAQKAHLSPQQNVGVIKNLDEIEGLQDALLPWVSDGRSHQPERAVKGGLHPLNSCKIGCKSRARKLYALHARPDAKSVD